MPSSIIYLDESGDLGWTFSAPYRNGGSSRFLTISALCTPVEHKHRPKRVVKKVYEHAKRPASKELKWVDLAPNDRRYFVEQTRAMCDAYPEIGLHAIVVNKQNVLEHIRKDSNKLYNYMIKLALLDRMATNDVVTLVPDPRSIKVESGNSLHDYLQTELWFTKKANTKLNTQPCDSQNSKGVQFADFLAGVVQSRFEDNDASLVQLLGTRLHLNRLFW
ncbi:hypothetical protein DSM104443_00935 [Usitatibacter rugosus]|uniref:DUF3800 domain-containing protein n=1 Tax=Usitatibacter rugosus TaxID=2732067 RepID=A0A6M4GS42_9PROT|nr:DUF3800 domain-containing protein [Usitatibacter rugosus]QJR09885.1 hypothetical protein DSM104443_00935 [Usitatibacter rugosus]